MNRLTVRPDVSVVIPCYNQGRFLSSALTSLQLQTLQNWECIIILDGCSDDSAQIAAELAAADPRVRVVSQTNKGPSAARNRGVAETTGKYVQFLDADDLLQGEKLAVHVEFLDTFQEVGIVYGDVRYFETESPTKLFFGVWGETKPWVPLIAEAAMPLMAKALTRNIMAMDCPLFRRSVLDRVGPFNEAVLGCEDWEYWIRCVATGIVLRYLERPETMALVRSHRDSTSRDIRRMMRGEILFRIRIGSLLRSNSVLRRQNFERGANLLKQLDPPDFYWLLFGLTKANLNLRVACYAALHAIDRKNWIRQFAHNIRGRSRGENQRLLEEAILWDPPR